MTVMKLYDRAGMNVTTIDGAGTVTTLTLGSALGAVAPKVCSFLDFGTAGTQNGDPVRVLVLGDAGAWELATYTYSTTGPSLTNRTVEASSNGNAKIVLNGNEQAFIVAGAADIVTAFAGRAGAVTPVEADYDAFYVAYSAAQALTSSDAPGVPSQQTQARENIYAAPFDATAYNGMQLNGSMDIDQEHSGASSTASGGYAVDGWTVAKTGTMVCTAQQVSDAPPGYSKSLKITVGTAESSLGASDTLTIFQPIEGYRTARLGWGAAGAQPLAIGFWAKAHRTGAYSGSVRNSALNRSYPFSFTISSADTWEWKTVVVSGDTAGTWLTTNGVGLYLTIAVALGSSLAGAANAWSASNLTGVTGTTNGVAATSDVFQITGVLVLPGIELPSSTRAPLVMRPLPEELPRCQRQYWHNASGNDDYAGFLRTNAAGNESEVSIFYPQIMRALPALGVTFAIAGGGGFTLVRQSTRYCWLVANPNNAGDYVSTFIADARL